MGLMIPVEHPVRVDARRAARVFAACGLPKVYAENLRPRDRAEYDAVHAAFVSDSDSKVHFKDGAMAIDELEKIAVANGGTAMYVDALFGNANARIWNDHAWIQVTKMPPGGIDEAARIIEETTGLVAPAVAGKHLLGAGRVVEFESPHLDVYVETPDRAAAYALFRRFADPSKVYGWISAPSAAALPHLPAFVAATGGEIDYELFVDAEVAADLTERMPCEQWQCDFLLYTPQTGALFTYLISSVPRPTAEEWIARMDEVLSRA